MKTDNLLEALGGVLKSEFGKRDERFDSLRKEVDSRLSSLDGNEVLKSAAQAVMLANAGALKTVADDILLRRAKLVSGTPPFILQELIE